MITPLPTIYAVDAAGNYLGGFAGCISARSVPRIVQVENEVDTGLLDKKGQPIRKTVSTEITEMVRQEYVIEPVLPEGAIVIDSPPEHAADVLKAGSWDTSKRPNVSEGCKP